MVKFKGKKSYGNYKTSSCPFCGKIATHKNEQGLEVCRLHTKQSLEEIKCSCGSWLEQRSGKFGPYFNCIKCGNINYKKGMEMKELIRPTYEDILGKDDIGKTSSVKTKPAVSSFSSSSYNDERTYTQKKENPKKERKEITISSNDVEYFD
ncbi:MAG: hypothetical protein KKA62_01935 [Nanoarchaeota archaeon]|nr:hypothetical protein [Nanoarchaeota archaeon]MBU1644354.1 hypothetical protein [Nanoarchaeota archaeon]MBU1976694.1 hypothetical protein [Nanoarchaeota archaeon]